VEYFVFLTVNNKQKKVWIAICSKIVSFNTKHKPSYNFTNNLRAFLVLVYSRQNISIKVVGNFSLCTLLEFGRIFFFGEIEWSIKCTNTYPPDVFALFMKRVGEIDSW
jgi:hypothetical protein